jgi:hypothetical protein
MSDVVLNPGAGGATLHTDTVAGVDTQIVKIGFAAAGISPVLVSSSNPFPTIVNNFPAIQNVAVTNFPNNQTVTVSNVVAVQGSFVIASSAIPIVMTRDDQFSDDDGVPYVNPNVPGADISTGDKQTQGNALLTSILASTVAPPITPITGTVSVTNLPSVQPISGTVIAVPSDDTVKDDEGIPYVNPNVPGADIATGDKQTQQLTALQAIQAGLPVTNFPLLQAVSVAVLPLPASAAVEMAGQLQRIADTLESILCQIRVNGILITQIGDAAKDSPDQIQNDLNLLN